MKDPKPLWARLALMILCVLLALTVCLLAWLFQLPTVEDAPGETPAVSPVSDLLQASDLTPDPTCLYQVYDATLRDGQDKPVWLHDLRGGTVLLLFWSSWCSDCKAYLTSGFSAAADAAEAMGAQLLLVCREGVRGDTYAQAAGQLGDCAVARDTLMDTQANLYTSLGLHSVPSLAVLDAQGRLVLSTADMPDAEAIQRMINYARGAQQSQLDAFVKRLILPDGGLTHMYSVAGDSLMPGNTVLSETQGLLMRYALRDGNQALFDQAWQAARERLLNGGLFAWQTVDVKRSDVNASLDDLRIIDALNAADERWGGYRADAAKLAHALYNATVSEQVMRDFVHIQDGCVSQQVTLCYQHPAAMKRLSALDIRWSGAAANAAELLKNGVISDDFPLYWPRYDTSANAYAGDTLHMAEALVTVLHAAEAGLVEERTLQWLESTLSKGPLYAAYDVQGQVVPGYGYESTAVYALAVQIGQRCARSELTRLALARMERLRCFEGALAGGYGSPSDRTVYAYDMLQALLAWQCVSAQ
ncbi:MAG: glycosyl hydrolase family 8 [Clostridiales bacterium]|nr:glycosyl hydrolase family 8 [Clostridiales bacterium]